TCACARASQELFIAHMKYISNRQNRWKINGFRIQRPPAAGPMSRDLGSSNTIIFGHGMVNHGLGLNHNDSSQDHTS
ncbi:MAG: hypothetical protein NTW21_18175, partial [Verrucomicrobia bacterium]|nr:hypothetical protein [Verrucomicrobiota bacterium]